MKRTLWLAAILAVPASILIACSGDDASVNNTTPDGGDGTDATVGTGTDSGGGTTDSGGGTTDSGGGGTKDSGPTVDPATCKDAGSAAACGACCESAYPGAETSAQKVALECACGGGDAGVDGGACKKECAATACAATPTAPDKDCNTCLMKGGKDSCEAKGIAACEADTACKGFLACGQTCPQK